MEESVQKRSNKKCAFYSTRNLTSLSGAKQSSTQSIKNVSSRKENLMSDQRTLSSNILNNHVTCAFNQSRKPYPHRWIAFMYQLELSILCLVRNSAHKSPSDQVTFGNYKIGQFNNIVLGLNGGLCIKINHVDISREKKLLNFNSLFSKQEGNFTLKTYLNEFAEELLYYEENVLQVPKYLIIYTNGDLDCTKGKKLIGPVIEMQNHLQLWNVNSQSDPELINFLFKNKGKTYRFANDAFTKKQLSSLVNFTNDVKEQLQLQGYSAEEIKETFFNRLILAADQPTLEELVHIVRSEVKSNEKYIQFRNEVMSQLVFENDCEFLLTDENLSSSVYNFNLFMLCLHEMFLNENISSLKFIETITSYIVALNLKKYIIYLKALNVDTTKLSLREFAKQREIFSIQSLFHFFVKELEDVDFFIIYTNASLSIVKELILGNNSKLTCPKFDRMDTKSKKYSFLNHACVNNNYLYKFSQEDIKVLLNSLITPTFKKKEIFSQQNDLQIKEMFLEKIVFAVKQYSLDEIYNKIEKEIEADNCKDLYKIAFRYLMSHELDAITKKEMVALCDNIKNKPNIMEYDVSSSAIDFAKSIFTLESPIFKEFVNFLTKGNGKMCLLTLKRNNIKFSCMSRFLQGSEENVQQSFLDLYNLWFDEQGNKRGFLKIFEKEGLNISLISKMLQGSGSRGPVILNKFYYLWFDEFGNSTSDLIRLRKTGLNLSNIAVLLHNSGVDCLDKLKALNALWFDENDCKSQCLKNLELNGINLNILCGVLVKSGETFPNLYNLWFNKEGKKSLRLKKLEEVEVGLSQVCRILMGSERFAPEAFLKLYRLWFKSKGMKSPYLKTLEEENVKLSCIFDILVKTGFEVDHVFTNLYSLWFDQNGMKTRYLQTVEANGGHLSEICARLKGTGCLAAEKCQQLFDALPFESPSNILISGVKCNQKASQVVGEADKVPGKMFECQEKKGTQR